MSNSKIAKKIGKIVVNVFLGLFLAVCIFSVFVTVLSKRDSDGAARVFGRQMRIVTSDSMAECEFTDVSEYKIKDIPVKSMVFIKEVPEDAAKADEFYRSLKVGDVLTFRYVYTTQKTITHRITSITKNENNDGYTIVLAGDNKNSAEGQLTQVIDTSIPHNMNYVIGKVTGQSKLLGNLMTFLKQPIGIVFLIILPCAVIIVFEVLRIINTFSEDKKKREQEKNAEKDKELEELRNRLAALEKEKNAGSEKVTEAADNSAAIKEDEAE